MNNKNSMSRGGGIRISETLKWDMGKISLGTTVLEEVRVILFFRSSAGLRQSLYFVGSNASDFDYSQAAFLTKQDLHRTMSTGLNSSSLPRNMLYLSFTILPGKKTLCDIIWFSLLRERYE